MTTASAYRLPGNVLPTKYSLTLTPTLTDFTFSGHETIDIQVTESTDRIAVNAIELEIADVQITLEDGTSLTAKDISLDEKFETATFTFDRDIPTGTAALHINFTGMLNDQLPAQRARSDTWRPPSSRPRTPAAPFHAGTTPRSRPSSR